MLRDKMQAWIEYPGLEGFEVHIVYLSRDELTKIRDAHLRTKFDPRTRERIQEVDDELFVKDYVNQSIIGWKGLTLGMLAQIMPIEIPEDVSDDEEVEYSQEDALLLVQNSPSFDGWVSEVQRDLSNFRSRK